MKVENAIKKLNKAGFEIFNESACKFQAIKDGCKYCIEFWLCAVDSQVVEMIKVRRVNDCNDMQSDYSAGSFYDTMAQAIRAAQ